MYPEVGRSLLYSNQGKEPQENSGVAPSIPYGGMRHFHRFTAERLVDDVVTLRSHPPHKAARVIVEAAFTRFILQFVAPVHLVALQAIGIMLFCV